MEDLATSEADRAFCVFVEALRNSSNFGFCSAVRIARTSFRLLADGFNLNVGLVVDGFGFAMPMRQDVVQLLAPAVESATALVISARDSRAAPAAERGLPRYGRCANR